MADRHISVLETNGPLIITIDFYQVEAELWREGGAAAFITMLAFTAENKLNDAGAIGPYEYRVIRGDGKVSAFVFQGREPN
jgi:hypothetical protein